MRLVVIGLMAVLVSLTGCKTLGRGGCKHQKYVKCVKCTAEDKAKETAKDQAKQAVKCKKCNVLKTACKCPEAACTKCKDGECKCKK